MEITYVTLVYPVICQDCQNTILELNNLNEWPYGWKYIVCHLCGGKAIPRFKNPIERTRTEKIDYVEGLGFRPKDD